MAKHVPVFVLAFALLLYQVRVGTAVAAEPGIDRLMVIFHVRQTTDLTVANLHNNQKFRALSFSQQNCLASVLTGDALFAEMRIRYREMFGDKELQADMLRFLASPTDQKLLARVFPATGDSASNSVQAKPLTDQDIEYAKSFAATRAGRRFASMQLDDMLNASVQKFALLTRRRCSSPPQKELMHAQTH